MREQTINPTKSNYTLGFLFDETGERVLLIEKQRPEWQKGRLNGIGGKMEEGETPCQCMKREFEEETGLEVSGWVHFATLSGDPKHSAEGEWSIYCFMNYANNSRFESYVSATDEVVYMVDVNELPFNTIPNLHWLIPMAFSLQRDHNAFAFEVTEVAR